MATIAIAPPVKFDVVEYIKKLRNAGATQEFAEVQAQEMEHALDGVLEQAKRSINDKNLSTKSDLRETELRLRLATLKFVVWTACVASVTVVGAVFTMLKLMLHQT